MKKSTLLTALTITVTGCTSIPTSLNSAPVPKDRLILKSQKDEKNSSEIVLIRDRSLSGSACYYAVYVDDKLAARIGASERAVFNLEPGERKLKVTRDPQESGLCSLGDDMTEQKITLGASDKKYFRLSMSMAGSPDLESIQPPADKF